MVFGGGSVPEFFSVFEIYSGFGDDERNVHFFLCFYVFEGEQSERAVFFSHVEECCESRNLNSFSVYLSATVIDGILADDQGHVRSAFVCGCATVIQHIVR